VDVALKVSGRILGVFQDLVSILVLVDVALKDDQPRLPEQPDRVSILVLVDVALKAKKSQKRHKERGCFNPCFRGCRSERLAA